MHFSWENKTFEIIFNGATILVYEWIGKFLPLFMMGDVTYWFWD